MWGTSMVVHDGYMHAHETYTVHIHASICILPPRRCKNNGKAAELSNAPYASVRSNVSLQHLYGQFTILTCAVVGQSTFRSPSEAASLD